MDQGSVWRWAALVRLWIYPAGNLGSRLLQASGLCTASWCQTTMLWWGLAAAAWTWAVGAEMGYRCCIAVHLHCRHGQQVASGIRHVHSIMMLDHHAVVRQELHQQGHGSVKRRDACRECCWQGKVS